MAKQRREARFAGANRTGWGRRSAGQSVPVLSDKIDQVDTRTLSLLRRLVSERGKIRSRRKYGLLPPATQSKVAVRSRRESGSQLCRMWRGGSDNRERGR